VIPLGPKWVRPYYLPDVATIMTKAKNMVGKIKAHKTCPKLQGENSGGFSAVLLIFEI
jgi:hypothetical protein